MSFFNDFDIYLIFSISTFDQVSLIIIEISLNLSSVNISSVEAEPESRGTDPTTGAGKSSLYVCILHLATVNCDPLLSSQRSFRQRRILVLIFNVIMKNAEYPSYGRLVKGHA
jgi:hypothetical protein